MKLCLDEGLCLHSARVSHLKFIGYGLVGKVHNAMSRPQRENTSRKAANLKSALKYFCSIDYVLYTLYSTIAFGHDQMQGDGLVGKVHGRNEWHNKMQGENNVSLTP